jgi:hypothetical protein
MRSAFLLLLAVSITCNNGRERVDEEGPRFGQIQGVYYSKDTINKTTLCLSGHSYGVYFLLKYDTSGMKILSNGRYEYTKPVSGSSDYEIGPPGYGVINFMEKQRRDAQWSSYAFFVGSGYQKTLVTDSLFGYVGQSFLDPITYGFRKQMYPYER